MNQTEYWVHGVRVERCIPLTPAQGARRIVFVHGGCHGSWSWVHFLPYFAQAGWDCHALNWYGHNGSLPHPEVGFLQRGIADVTEEIAHVAGQFEEPPVIVGHSMGALAAQKYAECHPVSALALLTPVVPTEVGGDVIDLPIDPTQPWGPPPFEIACDLFFQGLEEDEARTYFEKLCPESPKAVYEAAHWTVPIDRAKLSGPILVVSSELDHLTPPALGRALATFYGADYRYLRGRGHNVLLEPNWRETASIVAAWLDRETLPRQLGLRKERHMSVLINDDAPDFEADTTQGRIRFHEWIGDSWAVLFSHPKDFTPVCSTELGYMARIKHEFDRRSTKIIGLSIDALEDHARWASDIAKSQGLAPNYPIIGDSDLAVAKQYNMLPAGTSEDAAKRSAADNQTVRNVFVIGPDKKIKLILIYPMSTGRNFDEVLRALDSLQLLAKHHVATPANWRPGEDVIIPGSVSDEEARGIYPQGWKAPLPYLRLVPDPTA